MELRCWLGIFLGILGLSCSSFIQGKGLYDENLMLQTQSNQQIQLHSFQEKWLVLSFIFTNCPEACPLQTLKLARSQQLLNHNDLKQSHFVSISIDPQRDTPQALSSFAQQFSINEDHWIFARTRQTKDLDYFTDFISLGIQKSDSKANNDKPQDNRNIDHKLVVLLINPQGKIMQHYAGTRLDPKRLARELHQVITR